MKNEGETSKAEAELRQLDPADADVINAKGVVALRKNDFATAEQCFKKANTPEAKKNLGVVHILTGKYTQAAQELKDVDGCCHNTVLAYILTNQLDKAMSTAKCGDSIHHDPSSRLADVLNNGVSVIDESMDLSADNIDYKEYN